MSLFKMTIILGCTDGSVIKDITVFPCSTIGKLEPSYVIRKFLDAQRIHNLTAYLQALHRQSLANADHTTLLLNCYTKLKDSSKLEEFIKVQHFGKFLNGRWIKVQLHIVRSIRVFQQVTL